MQLIDTEVGRQILWYISSAIWLSFGLQSCIKKGYLVTISSTQSALFKKYLKDQYFKYTHTHIAQRQRDYPDPMKDFWMPKKFSTVSRDANLCHHFQNKLEGCCISVCMTMSRLKPIGMKIVSSRSEIKWDLRKILPYCVREQSYTYIFRMLGDKLWDDVKEILLAL